jgi:hypothetical protein
MNMQIETSPLTQELYSIDWSKRFNEFREAREHNYGPLFSLLTQIEKFVKKQLNTQLEELGDINKLEQKFNKAEPESDQWHCLSILINLKIIHAAIPRGLTSTATLSAMQIMEHMWKVLARHHETQSTGQSVARPSGQKPAKATAPERPADSNSKTDKKPEQVKQTLANYTSRAKNNKPAAKSSKTENVVIKKLAESAGSDSSNDLADECYRVACALAEEYPEYTLTAIRVMTAEKLGVTRQFIENLDIRPDRFKNAS